MNIDEKRLQILLDSNLGHLAEIRKLYLNAVEAAASQPEKQLIPIPFFGDLDAYSKSERRILTLGLNPSNREFRPGAKEKDWRPRFRFNPPIDDARRLRDELCSYFKNNPYSWFNSFERVLSGCEATFGSDPCKRNTALHIDVCSPIATFPTWSNLRKDNLNTKRLLTKAGNEFFLTMIEIFRPHIIIASVGWAHLKKIDDEFSLKKDWTNVHIKKMSKDGSPVIGKSPPTVRGRHVTISKWKFYFANGSLRNRPFDLFGSENQKYIGEQIFRNSKH